MKHICSFSLIFFLGLLFTPLSNVSGEPVQDTKIRFVEYDVPPAPVEPIVPSYPETAAEAGIEGIVIVQAFVDENGDVTQMKVLKGVPNTGLDESAMKAIQSTKFTPALQKESPVGVWISIPIRFKLEDSPKE